MKRSSTEWIYRPAETGWEWWKMPWDGEPVHETEVQPGGKPSDVIWVALPSAGVSITPLWLNTTDPHVLAEMVDLQLALVGMSGTTKDPQSSLQTVLVEENRTLVTFARWEGELPEELSFGDAKGFAPTAEFEQLPPNQLTLWRERDSVICAITRGERVVYWECLGQGAIDEALFQSLRCLLVRLALEEMILEMEGVTLWTALEPSETWNLARELAMRVTVAERPAPRFPNQTSTLLPPAIQEVRRQRQQRQTIWMIGGWAAAAILLVAGLLGGALLVRGYEVSKLEAEVAHRQAEVDEVRQALVRWASLRPALDSELYVVERLYHAATLMPESGLLLSRFDQSLREGEIILSLSGEANSSDTAFAFITMLRNNAAWEGFTWGESMPSILPNASATFSMEGRLSYENVF